MARLIDAMKTVTNLSGRITSLIKMGENPMRVYEEVLQVIAEAPTVDAVEVVRCRDCKYWKPSGNKAGNSVSDMEYIGGCKFTNYCRRESDFCSYGERKDGDWNG